MSRSDIPVVVFIFKRDKAVEVIKRIAEVKPLKLYILADNGRNEKEQAEAKRCRELVEEAITWDCEVIKNYATENRGVFENIGMGARWVFEREKRAIFLEDDNLPEITFFQYCKEMLEMYEDDTRILWVCGTNYLGKYPTEDGSSYVFTKHMLPCGWASWSDKFLKFYDGSLRLCENELILSRVKREYFNIRLYRQYRRSWLHEFRRTKNGKKPVSWDYHMDFALKANGLYGISPCYNQIKNIGVDQFSEHGGTSFDDVMVKRFCGVETYPMSFPLKHPHTVLPDYTYEREIARILTYPIRKRLKNLRTKILRALRSL